MCTSNILIATWNPVGTKTCLEREMSRWNSKDISLRKETNAWKHPGWSARLWNWVMGRSGWVLETRSDNWGINREKAYTLSVMDNHWKVRRTVKRPSFWWFRKHSGFWVREGPWLQKEHFERFCRDPGKRRRGTDGEAGTSSGQSLVYLYLKLSITEFPLFNVTCRRTKAVKVRSWFFAVPELGIPQLIHVRQKKHLS